MFLIIHKQFYYFVKYFDLSAQRFIQDFSSDDNLDDLLLKDLNPCLTPYKANKSRSRVNKLFEYADHTGTNTLIPSNNIVSYLISRFLSGISAG
jgi:hypothetical protein